jgi:DNA polymerase-3 subunit epsilon
MRFLALDFETANHSPDSACAVGAVLGDANGLLHQYSTLIRPPTPNFAFTHIHGLTWAQCAEAPPYDLAWDDIDLMLQEAEVIVAHNARFDLNVMLACHRRYRMSPPELPVACTVLLARRAWGMKSNRLSSLAAHFGLDLNHHEALSDARACARIFQMAIRDGADVSSGLVSRGRPSPALRAPSP